MGFRTEEECLRFLFQMVDQVTVLDLYQIQLVERLLGVLIWDEYEVKACDDDRKADEGNQGVSETTCHGILLSRILSRNQGRSKMHRSREAGFAIISVMKNLRYQLPKIMTVIALIGLLWWTYYSFIAGPVNKVLIQREQAIEALMEKSAFGSCSFLYDSQLDDVAIILECLSQNSERLIIAIDSNGTILSRFRLEKADEELMVSELRNIFPEMKTFQWAYYGQSIVVRLIDDYQETYLDRNDRSVIMKVRLNHD